MIGVAPSPGYPHSEDSRLARLSDLAVDASWRAAHPGAIIGLLALGAIEPGDPRPFAARRAARAEELRQRLAGKSRADLLAELPALRAYADYYRRFKKTYHVLLQLESVAFKGRPIAGPGPLVETAFMAELHNLLLTATHDLDMLAAPLRLAAADGTERYAALGGQVAEAKAGDMLMADAAGTVCTVIHGQAARGSVSTATSRALFVVYAPPAIAPSLVSAHLAEIETLVRLFAPGTEREGQDVIGAG